ncbi:MAG: phosphatase PAP2 family protein [Candidatus Hodarchaeales archaeon]
MPTFTTEKAVSAFTTPINLVALFAMILMLIGWYSARLWQTPEFVEKRIRFFSPRVTQILQEKFRSKPLDWFTTQIWFWVFGTSIFIQWFICMYQGPEAWRYGFPIVTTVISSMTIQLLYPVVVPIRYGDFGREIPVQLIRFETFESSDIVNGLLYNGLPSNHLGMVITGLWLTIKVNSIDPWSGYIVLFVFFVLLAISFIFSVLYLGEHYWQDLLASCIVYPTGLISLSTIIDWVYPIA